MGARGTVRGHRDQQPIWRRLGEHELLRPGQTPGPSGLEPQELPAYSRAAGVVSEETGSGCSPGRRPLTQRPLRLF